ncbi:hypothetical protein [Nocardia transvalensis]|uniref:hypothetical protein n=1 Tax=Nocardia transvalensis TaxID=37333 RepID=UPI0018962C26|nr:hypothetical protein [Nocardia transvalensis]MBF6333576.1 hypothetical protein [Nocardia transvalensis]
MANADRIHVWANGFRRTGVMLVGKVPQTVAPLPGVAAPCLESDQSYAIAVGLIRHLGLIFVEYKRLYGGLLPAREGRHVLEGSAHLEPVNVADWDDGRTTKTLQWATAAGTPAWDVANWADTAIEVIEAVRVDDSRDKLSDRGFVRDAMRDVRRLRTALAALEDELLRAARADHGGRPLLSWREIGRDLLVHHSTVSARYERLEAGETAEYHKWLEKGTGPADTWLPRSPYDDEM